MLITLPFHSRLTVGSFEGDEAMGRQMRSDQYSATTGQMATYLQMQTTTGDAAGIAITG